MSLDNLTNYVIRKADPVLVCFILLMVCKKKSGMFSITAEYAVIPKLSRAAQRYWNRKARSAVSIYACWPLRCYLLFS